MKTATAAPVVRHRNHSQVPSSYAGLCAEYLPRPIHTQAEARVATTIVEALAGYPLNRDQEDYLEAVAHFLDSHDRAKNAALPKADARAVLDALMESHGLDTEDLARILGSQRQAAALILSGERPLNLVQIRKLAGYFSVNPGVFV